MNVRTWLPAAGLGLALAIPAVRAVEADSAPPVRLGRPQPLAGPPPAAVKPAAPGATVRLAGGDARPVVTQLPAAKPTPPGPPGGPCRLTLDEAKERVRANNKLLNLAALNIESKEYATKVVQANYFPQVVGNSVYLHFNDPLGKVLTTPGRKVTGPAGRVLTSIPALTVEAAVLNQDSSFSTITAVQPLTDLLKVRQGVKIARADEGIAQAQLEKGTRELLFGVEQLYWGIVAVQRIAAGAREEVRGAELLASKLPTVEVRTALAEARQGLQQAQDQLADLQEKLNFLLDLPPCTQLDLIEPPLPVLPFGCADEVINLVLAASPEVREAEQTVVKARAALAAAKVDCYPNIALVGGYVDQTGASYIQQDFGYVGVIGSYAILDWGKRRNTKHERETLVSMATLKLSQSQDEVRQKALKAFREVGEKQVALKTAQELAELHKELVKKATTPEAFRNPEPLLRATKDAAVAAVDLIKADLAYRQAYAQLMSLVSKQ
jgi:outer membrane protein TolC